MSNLTHLFKPNQRVNILMDGVTHPGVITETFPDHIIVDVLGISDHCWFENGTLDCVYPEYNCL